MNGDEIARRLRKFADDLEQEDTELKITKDNWCPLCGSDRTEDIVAAWTCGSRRGLAPDTTVIQSGRCRKMAVTNRFARLESELRHVKKCIQELTDMVLTLRKLK